MTAQHLGAVKPPRANTKLMDKSKYYKEAFARSSQKGKELLETLEGCFAGDAEVHVCCRTYTRADLKKLNTGVEQRGEAIRRFLDDHLSGKKNYLKSKFIPPSVVKRILERNPCPIVSASLAPDQLQFFYGPDVIRDFTGNFCVLEDNVGFVGGFGDLTAFRRASEIIRRDPSGSFQGDPFYARMAGFFWNQAKLYGNKRVLLLSYPRKHRENHEDSRLASNLKEFGITEITSTRSLAIRDKLLFYKGERVSFLISNVDVKDIEPFTSKGSVDFFASKVVGFWDGFKSGGFGLSSHPASECAGDKEFYGYVENMVRFYLKQEPILKNIKAKSLSSARNRAQVFSNLNRWVIKSAIGHGGSKVWIGKTLSPKSADRLRKLVDAKPFNFVAQVYTELSRLNELSVDARPLSIISGGKVIVSELPWGRGAVASKPRKVNLGSGGCLVISHHQKTEV
jgi:uncharacterized circularly permuted ATP-grasp superfamily protein